MFTKNLMTVLSLSVLLTHSFAYGSRAGMDRCLETAVQLKPTDYAISISKPQDSRNTNIGTLRNNRFTLLGSLTPNQISRINPALRQLASGGLVVGYVVTGIGLVAGGVVVGLSSAVAAPGIVATVGTAGTAGAATVVASNFDSVNAVAQFERANVEKCLRESSRSLSSGESVIIKMRDRSDFQNTVQDLRDLINDVKN